jgi:tetratricopeptide (TPR) repeat protein
VGCRLHVPVWHEATREWVKQGRLALLGVTQEQHADRCRLFGQWKRFDWPILHDPINLLEAPAVPIVVAIDEHGIVRAIRPNPDTLEAEFLDRAFADDAPPGAPGSAGPPDPVSLRRTAEANPTAGAWRSVGDALTIWGGADKAGQAIDAYARALTLDPTDKNSWFRLGVAHRMRHESAGRTPGDFQAAINAWGRALELDPNQYIWRRRIEQYGPRLAKPYAFYDWVVQAKAEISRRGETPVPLVIEPYGSELAGRVRDVVAEPSAPAEPDPQGRIHRDLERLIEAEVVVVPARVRPGHAARIHLTFRPSAAHRARWNNESTPLRVWIGGAEAWTIASRLLEAPRGDQPESVEVRRLDFEAKAPAAAQGRARLAAYALYNTCEEAGGRCLFLRQDLTIELDVAK